MSLLNIGVGGSLDMLVACMRNQNPDIEAYVGPENATGLREMDDSPESIPMEPQGPAPEEEAG